jgi:hypothetical protein
VERNPTIPIVLLLLTLVSFSMLPSGVLLKQAKAQDRPSTIITAFDGNHSVIPNGGTINSNTIIMFRFETTGGVPPFTYTCKLDGTQGNGMPFDCNNPAFGPFPPGMYLFYVTPTDSTGDTGLPSLFSWTVVSTQQPPPSNPIQATQQLIQLTNSLHLSAATQQVLDAQLNSAIQSFQNNIKVGGCGHLNGFATAVRTYLQVGRLTQTQATQLLQGVQSVEKIAGC